MSDTTSPPPPRRLPLSYWLPLAAWLAVMLFLSSTPNPRAVLGRDVMSLGDAILHGGGFALLAILVCRAAFYLAGRKGLRPLLWTLLACAAYGLLDELHQIPIPGRYFAWTDWLADVGGTTVGCLIASGIRRMGRR